MEPRTDPTTLDLASLERRLERRACWHDAPEVYRAGVRDALAAVRGRARDAPDGSRIECVG